MDLCNAHYTFSFALEGSCGGCPLKGEERKIYTLDGVVPQKLCPLAYYSIVPYWVSLVQGAWFRWRENKDDVICQCPRPQGVIFLVRKVIRQGRQAIEAEVTGIGNSPCPYQYSVGQVFTIESVLCPALFPSLWVQLDVLSGLVSRELEVECCLAPVSIRVRRV